MATELEASVWGDEIDALESELVSTIYYLFPQRFFSYLTIFPY